MLVFALLSKRLIISRNKPFLYDSFIFLDTLHCYFLSF